MMDDKRLQEIKARVEAAVYDCDYMELESLALHSIPDLIAEVERLRAELEAARGDMRELSGHYKICKFCMYDKGGGVSDCKDYKCDSENHYDWRGLCAENGGANGRVD